MISANNITRMTDVTSVEMSMTENVQMGQPLMIRSTTEMTLISNEMITIQTTGINSINSTETSEMTEAPRMTEIFETTVD